MVTTSPKRASPARKKTSASSAAASETPLAPDLALPKSAAETAAKPPAKAAKRAKPNTAKPNTAKPNTAKQDTMAPARKRRGAGAVEAPTAEPVSAEPVSAVAAASRPKPAARPRKAEAAAALDAAPPVPTAESVQPVAAEAAQPAPKRSSRTRKSAVSPAQPPAGAVSADPAGASPGALEAAPGELAQQAPADLAQPIASSRKRPSRRKPAAQVTEISAMAEAAEAAPVLPSPYRLAAAEALEQGVFGDYELAEIASSQAVQLRLLGRDCWRCSCAGFARDGGCEHGEALIGLLGAEQRAALDAGWPAREAEVWLVPGLARRLQWVAGHGVPPSLKSLARQALDEAGRIPAEQAHGWLQALLDEARLQGLPLRVAPEVWAQLALGRDTQARVARVEQWLQGDASALSGALREPIADYQWEAALFAVCAGRALIADDIGLGQRDAALAATQLYARLFGLDSAQIVAPAARHGAWQRDIQRLLGEWPAGLGLAEVRQGGRPARPLQLLIVDGIDGLDEAALAELRALDVPQLMLLADGEPLGDARLSGWVEWLDLAHRGPQAALRSLPTDAGKRAQREALQTVLLSRRKREMLNSLPPALLQSRWLQVQGAAMPKAALQTLATSLQRWQQHRYLASAEQQQLLQALAQLPLTTRHAVKAKAETLLALRDEWLAPGGAAARLLVCAQSETVMDGLEQALRLRKAPAVLRLRAGMDRSEREAELESWRSQAQAMLLASDAALAGLEDATLGEPRLGLIHADLCAHPAQAQLRLERACGPTARGVLALQLLVEDSIDRPLLAARQAGQALPAWLATAPVWLSAAEIAELMPAVQALLAAVAAG